MGDEQDSANADANVEMHVAVNSIETADNLRQMGFEGAGDELERAGKEVAQKALRDGYVDKPPEPEPLLPGQERIGSGLPQPATTMGEPTFTGPGGMPEPPEWPDYHEPPDPYEPGPIPGTPGPGPDPIDIVD